MNIVATFAKHKTTRDSGAEWLEEVPSDWEVKKMKFLFRDHSQKGMPNAELLSVTQNQGVVPRTWVENRMVMPSGNLESFKFINEGDFAISLRSFEGGLELCHHDGIISPAYTVLKRRSENMVPAYYRYLFKSPAFISELQTSVVGIREGKNISFEELSYSLIPKPHPDEQRAIAAFLDRKCATIDEAVRITEEQITLLRDRRQILIQQAVTRGLNPSASMKDSGSDWIGEIPAHWEVTPLKRLFRERNERTETGKETLLSLRMIEGLVPHDEVSEKPISDAELVGYKKVYPGQLVMNRMRASIGLFGIVDQPGLVSPDYAIFDMRNDLFGPYYLSLFKTKEMGARFRVSSRGLGTGSSGFMRLYTDDFGAISVPTPSRSEQEDIVEYIDGLTEKINDTLEIKKSQIDTLKEYKRSLINAAVTGKIKVI